MEDQACENTNKEIWREIPDDYYAPSIFVTEQGAVGINVGGLCIVKDVRDWHLLGATEGGVPTSIVVTLGPES